MNINLSRFKEARPHRFKMLVWRAVNRFVYSLAPRHMRKRILLAFGAKIGSGGYFYRHIKIYAPWNLEIGDGVCIAPFVDIYNKERVVIGSHVVISQDTYICTASHDITSPIMETKNRPIQIGDNSWIAAKAALLPGVRIGEGAVVGACSVVVRDVEPWTVVGGNPAVFLKKRVLREAE